MSAATQHVLSLADRDVPLIIRRNRRARRMTLRADAARGRITLTLPARAALREGLGFVDAQRDWLVHQLTALSAGIPFTPGRIIPFMGGDLRLEWQAQAPRVPGFADTVLKLGGPCAHFARHVERWLRAQARLRLSEDSAAFAAVLDLPPPPVAVRDTRSQWGSCSVRGRLSFAWRLVCAPPFVRRAVAAHEVAHLRHRNHGSDFHALVERLAGRGEAKRAREWLRAHGPALHRIGRE